MLDIDEKNQKFNSDEKTSNALKSGEKEFLTQI